MRLPSTEGVSMKLPLRLEHEGNNTFIMDAEEQRLCESRSTDHQPFTTDEGFMVSAVEALNSLYVQGIMTHNGEWV